MSITLSDVTVALASMSLFTLLPVTCVPSTNVALVSFAGVSPAITLGHVLVKLLLQFVSLYDSTNGS